MAKEKLVEKIKSSYVCAIKKGQVKWTRGSRQVDVDVTSVYNFLKTVNEQIKDYAVLGYMVTNKDEVESLITETIDSIYKNKQKEVANKVSNTYSSIMDFVSTNLDNFYPVDDKTGTWDIKQGLSIEDVNPYLVGVKRPWSLTNIISSFKLLLTDYNKSVPNDLAHLRHNSDDLGTAFDLTLEQYKESFDKKLREKLAYDGSDPKITIGHIIDEFKITGNRDLQIAKIWQYAINVKRSLYSDKKIKREWHVCPVICGKAGTGKTTAIKYFFSEPLASRGGSTKIENLSKAQWANRVGEYYTIVVDDITVDKMTVTEESNVKSLITSDNIIDRQLGSNSNSAFREVESVCNFFGSCNVSVTEFLDDDGMIRRMPELNSELPANTSPDVYKYDPLMIYKSIDENNLEYNPLKDPAIDQQWKSELAKATQGHWIYKALRALKLMPMIISASYKFDSPKCYYKEDIIKAIKNWHKDYFACDVNSRIYLSEKLRFVGVEEETDKHGKAFFRLDSSSPVCGIGEDSSFVPLQLTGIINDIEESDSTINFDD